MVGHGRSPSCATSSSLSASCSCTPPPGPGRARSWKRAYGRRWPRTRSPCCRPSGSVTLLRPRSGRRRRETGTRSACFSRWRKAAPRTDQMPLEELAKVRLTDYLQRGRRSPPTWFGSVPAVRSVRGAVHPRCRRAARADRLSAGARGRAARPGRWALFAMREDYIAQLDPYLGMIPTRLASRYRLDLLGPTAAKVAARAPARAAQIEFMDDAADRLVDDLRRVKVQRGDRVTDELGPSVEPVQLQVVCRQLWDSLAEDDEVIDVEDVDALGDVDDTLAEFYVDQVQAAAARTGVGEREIRTWFDEVLITSQGFRAQALEGPGHRGDAVLGALEDAHLIRADQRRGARWYELRPRSAGCPHPRQQSGLAGHAPELAPAGGTGVGSAVTAAGPAPERFGPARGRALGRPARGRAIRSRPRLPGRLPDRGSTRPRPSGGPRSATAGWPSSPPPSARWP